MAGLNLIYSLFFKPLDYQTFHFFTETDSVICVAFYNMCILDLSYYVLKFILIWQERFVGVRNNISKRGILSASSFLYILHSSIMIIICTLCHDFQ